jgi:hypothetical protein
MKFTVEWNWIDVVGIIWQGCLSAQTIKLDARGAAIEADVYGAPDTEQGKHITPDLIVSHDDAPDPGANNSSLQRLGGIRCP